MKRLRDGDAPEHALARRLLSAVEPLERSPARRTRVWRALSRHAAPRRSPRALAALALAFGMSGAAIAGATHGGLWTWPSVLGTLTPEGRPPASRVEASRPASAPSVGAPSTSNVRDEASALAEEPAAPGLEQRAPAQRALPSSGGRAPNGVGSLKPPARGEPSVARRSSDAAQAKAPPSEESKLLLEALRARRRGETDRAEALASDYQRRNPNGALAEEALVLRLEGAIARQDPAAGALAREYLARFSTGRFASQARRALEPRER